MPDNSHAYPPIGDYALIGDCHSAALVSREGAVEWCCMPRVDAGSMFARLLDRERGGHCSIRLVAGEPGDRAYADDALVLETTLHGEAGDGVLSDCLTVREGGARDPDNQLLRVVECRRGTIEVEIDIAPRFDYGSVRPWLRRHAPSMHTAVGGDDGLAIWCDAVRPEEIEFEPPRSWTPEELDGRLEATLAWWRRWTASGRPLPGPEAAGAQRSAMVLKALQNARTGAIAAAPTTSLPEAAGGSRNWDYRYSWIRDSAYSVRALAELGFESEADGFRRFVQRTSAGSVEDLRVVYGVGGERRLNETELDLHGWRGSRPVRAGNAASGQIQLDALGELVNLAWRWHRRGHSPDDDLWRFLVELVDSAAERWDEPDAGIWEWRGDPRHFVHSKAMCWAALERGLELAEESMRKAPERRWRAARDAVREAVETEGFDSERGTFVQAFGSAELDAAVLLLPTFGFIAWDDSRMVSTVDAVRAGLDAGDGLLFRYTEDDGLEGKEGAFLACSFWLVECLAHQGRAEEAQAVFDRAVATSNDLGLFGEEYDPEREEILGNFPQGLTHLAHIAAAVELNRCRVSAG
jgi:GH15 family glucan-1,4-alpha-glucosidase